jgi:hypothetical protein
MSTPPTSTYCIRGQVELGIRRRIAPPARALHQHQRLLQRLGRRFQGNPLRRQPSEPLVPARFGKGREAIEQGVQGGQGVVWQEWGSQSEQQLAIGGLLDDLEQGAGADEGFGVEGVWSSGGFGAWVLGGERLGEVVDVLCCEGLARDGSLCLFDGLDCTSIPQFSNTLSSPLDKGVIDMI